MAQFKLVTDDRVWGEIERAAAISGGTAPHGAGDIATQIQRLITTGDLPEGARLPSERDLAGIFATSRPTVSQAIRILVVRGLIESRRGSGAYVDKPARGGTSDNRRLDAGSQSGIGAAPPASCACSWRRRASNGRSSARPPNRSRLGRPPSSRCAAAWDMPHPG